MSRLLAREIHSSDPKPQLALSGIDNLRVTEKAVRLNGTKHTSDHVLVDQMGTALRYLIWEYEVEQASGVKNETRTIFEAANLRTAKEAGKVAFRSLTDLGDHPMTPVAERDAVVSASLDLMANAPDLLPSAPASPQPAETELRHPRSKLL